MADFTSALYLGMEHASNTLPGWDALTLGRPAALREPCSADEVAAELARLQGCEAATLLPSTLHLFWDLFRVLGTERVTLLCDSAMYPIARWGVERAAAMGIPVKTFSHHAAGALAHLALLAAEENRKPVIVTDGYCPSCGRAAPIRAYAEIAKYFNGYLVLDDTQALGVLGEARSSDNSYGEGGGGSLRWHGAFGPHIVVGASLAKGFGAPVAVLAGSHEWIDRFRKDSETRVHCSPPSVAAIYAARRALLVNRRHGGTLRRRLAKLVVRFRQRLVQAGLTAVGRLPFPAQTFLSGRWPPVAILHKRLLCGGVVGLLTRACKSLTASLTLIVTARHRLPEIEHAAQVVARAMRISRGHLSHYTGAA
jgi:8-amino-7-oxononanoate synthase